MFYTKANIFLCPQELSWVMINLKSCEILNAIEILPRQKESTGSSRLMRISLLRISLLRFFKTITKIWLMRFYGLFILLLRT